MYFPVSFYSIALCNRVKGHGKYIQMTSLKAKFIT